MTQSKDLRLYLPLLLLVPFDPSSRSDLHLPSLSSPKQKGPEPKARTLNPKPTYCGGGGGVSVIGLGASGAFGAVNPGIAGACARVPLAAS
jgi:hypothetical protein